MTYLLDTDICIYILNERPPKVSQKFREVRAENIALSSITIAELLYGAEKSRSGERNRRALAQFMAALGTADFTADVARVYARLRVSLERQGTPIGPLDTLIAAHALSLNATLVTNNTREFSKVPDLPLENWAEDA